MKVQVLVFFLAGLTAFFAGCNSTEVDANLGSGSLTYEGQSYSLNFLTAYTYSSEEGYRHNSTITHTEDGRNVFSFSILDNNSQNTINPGTYEMTFNGDYTARFAIRDLSDSLAGTMQVSISDGYYTFNFEGSTVDENSELGKVVFTYTGKNPE